MVIWLYNILFMGEESPACSVMLSFVCEKLNQYSCGGTSIAVVWAPARNRRRRPSPPSASNRATPPPSTVRLDAA